MHTFKAFKPFTIVLFSFDSFWQTPPILFLPSLPLTVFWFYDGLIDIVPAQNRNRQNFAPVFLKTFPPYKNSFLHSLNTDNNMATNPVELTEPEREIFAKISANDVTGLKLALAQFKTSIDFVDENGMSPLQHACYKQNAEAVQSLLDRVRKDLGCKTKRFMFPT